MKEIKVKIIIYSDYICPFCFIGKNRVDRLKVEFEHDIDIEWKGFELYPEDVPLPDVNDNHIKMAWLHVEQLAEEDKIDIKRPSRHPRSKLAHEAAEYARERGKFQQFHDALFEAYFLQDRDIRSIKVLLEIARDIGLNVEGLEDCLRNRCMKEKVEKNQREAMEKYKVYAVPTIIISGKKKIVGAQPYRLLKNSLVETIERNKKSIT